MFRKWIQRDIASHVGTRSSMATQEILAPLVEKGTRKRPPRLKIWEGVHQTTTVIQVNYRSGKI